jgi:hypothetical protein
VWYTSIPEFDAAILEHRELVRVGEHAAARSADVPIFGAVGFQRARGMIRDELRANGLLTKADDLLRTLLAS